MKKNLQRESFFVTIIALKSTESLLDIVGYEALYVTFVVHCSSAQHLRVTMSTRTTDLCLSAPPTLNGSSFLEIGTLFH